MPPRLKERYREEIVPALVKEFGYANAMQAPRVEKVTLNVGTGEAVQNAKALDAASTDIATITGQHPVITRAKKSIANFKLREGMPIGVMVTLRGDHMWEFLDRTLNAALPRIRDFQNRVRQNRQDPRHANNDLHDRKDRRRRAAATRVARYAVCQARLGRGSDDP